MLTQVVHYPICCPGNCPLWFKLPLWGGKKKSEQYKNNTWIKADLVFLHTAKSQVWRKVCSCGRSTECGCVLGTHCPKYGCANKVKWLWEWIKNDGLLPWEQVPLQLTVLGSHRVLRSTEPCWGELLSFVRSFIVNLELLLGTLGLASSFTHSFWSPNRDHYQEIYIYIYIFQNEGGKNNNRASYVFLWLPW